jgi:transposase
MSKTQHRLSSKAREDNKFLAKKQEELDKGEITPLDFKAAIKERTKTFYSVPDKLRFTKLKNSKVSKRRLDEILELMDKGYPKTTAAQEAGISKPTLLRWQQAGQEVLNILAEGEEKGKDPVKYFKEVTGLVPKREQKMLAEFVMNIERRIARQEKKSLDKLQDSQDWRAHAWLLERSFPEKYGEKKRLEVDQDVQISVNFVGGDIIDITPEIDG